MSAVVKSCRICGMDVSRVERFKDPKGRYLCAPCNAKMAAKAREADKISSGGGGNDAGIGASDQPSGGDDPFADAGIGLDDLLVAPAPTSPCPECGKALSVDARLCVGCGYSKETGRVMQAAIDPPGMTKSDRKQKADKPHACLNCGYNLKGLKVPKCPECGTVDNHYRRKKQDDKGALVGMYVRPLIGAAIGAAIFAGVVAANHGPIASAFAIGFLGAAIVLGFITYIVCSMMFIGFDEPLGVTFVRVACVWSIYNGVAALIDLIPFGGFLLWPVKVLLFIGLLISIMEIELEDAWGVAVGCMLVNVALTIGFVALMSQ